MVLRLPPPLMTRLIRVRKKRRRRKKRIRQMQKRIRKDLGFGSLNGRTSFECMPSFNSIYNENFCMTLNFLILYK